MATPKEAFQASVKARINGDKDHGWGKDDSIAVIDAIFTSETGEPMTDEVKKYVGMVVNPSAFRQDLENSDVLNKAAAKIKGVLADLLK